MINSISVSNYRCFKQLDVPNCTRLNVIVGDNGSGKTALLESIFWPLATTSEMGLRFRQQRGLDGAFAGQPSRIEQAIWGGFFHNQNLNSPISLIVNGDSTDDRRLEISRRFDQQTVYSALDGSIESSDAKVRFGWIDHQGTYRPAQPNVSEQGLQFPSTGENNDKFFYFSATQPIGSTENASRFSELRQKGRHEKFLELFKREYSWISNIDIEVSGGSAVLFATLEDSGRMHPLPNVSSGINRAVGFLLCIAVAEGGVLLIDEIENGIHYTHLAGIWRTLLSFSREFNCQLFVSTHSQECLSALAKAAGSDMGDISLWQMERQAEESTVRQFSGEDLKLALEYQEEVR